jgi:signal transduction histidine kinase
MPSTPVGLRAEYPVDAGRSRAIYDALVPLVEEIRELAGADLGIIAFNPAPLSAPADLVVLAASAAGTLEPPLPSEPLHVTRRLPRRVPRLLQDVTIASPARPYVLELRSAVAVPWADAAGSGVVLVGNRSDRPIHPPHPAGAHRRQARRVALALAGARRAGAHSINGDLRRAVNDVAESAVASDDVHEALAAMLASARDLFGAEVSYLSLPERDINTFTFDQMVGIRTTQFRHLRIEMGQGLGGLARSLRHPVRSLDYARDTRLHAAPVTETVAEGIVSAMATPVLIDDEVNAVLYVGNRHLRPFSELDGELLNEFAGYAALGLRRRLVESYRSRVIRRQERERFALDLHDSVVRGLVEIGFTAEAGRAGAADPALRGQLEAIGLIAERCMDTLRDQLAVLAEHREDDLAGHPATVLDRIGEAGHRPSTARSLELVGSGTASVVLPAATADALVRIGQEAVANAETHAGGRHTRVSLEVGGSAATLSVTDDGRGLDAAALDEVLAGAVPHLGFRAMRAAAAYVGGHLTIEPATEGGLTVRAVLPLRRPDGHP